MSKSKNHYDRWWEHYGAEDCREPQREAYRAGIYQAAALVITCPDLKHEDYRTYIHRVLTLFIDKQVTKRGAR